VGKRPPAQEERLVQALKMIAPGTAIRGAIDNIVRAHTGALLVFADEAKIRPMISGGIDIDVGLSPMILYELCKMDGAILLDAAGTHILHANVQLMPDARIESQETGTRHRTAERVAKQIDSLAISISAARDVVTVYVGDIRYIMDPIRTILDKADQALDTMEKFRVRFNEVSTSLSLLEFQDAVTLHDVLSVLQRAEMMLVIVQEIEGYIIQLGTEGRLVELQLEEMLVNVREERTAVLQDYLPEVSPATLQSARAALGAVSPDDLLSLAHVGAAIGFGPDAEPLDKHLRPRGYRLLGKIPRLSDRVVEAVVSQFGDLSGLVEATVDEIAAVDGVGIVRARDIKEGLARIHELSLLERRG
jgi:diadenylate cyclase